jgi:hypothetical protein
MKDLSYVINIPIYRWSQDEHEIKYSNFKHEFMSNTSATPDMESYKQIEYHVEKNYWHCWIFNEIIGWLSLLIVTSHLKNDLYIQKQSCIFPSWHDE